MEMAAISDDMRDFIEGLPKAELHVHLEGTLGPETVLKLAARNELDYPLKTVKDIQDALNNRTAGLVSFLDLHYLFVSVIKTREDFHEITYEFLRKCRENNVVYVETKFDPQLHTEHGIPFPDIIKGIDQGRKDGHRDFGVEANLIMCINRERTLESAWETLDQAHPYRHLITGLGLDSYEQDNPPSKYTEIYQEARKQGYRVTAHCDVDQQDSVGHIWECIDLLKTDRIDHGVNSIEDPDLVEELIRRDITLTACPTWRHPYPTPRDHQRIREMYDLGLKVTLNTDDPAEYTTGYMNTTLTHATQQSHYTQQDLTNLTTNALQGAWTNQKTKNKHQKTLHHHTETTHNTNQPQPP